MPTPCFWLHSISYAKFAPGWALIGANFDPIQKIGVSLRIYFHFSFTWLDSFFPLLHLSLPLLHVTSLSPSSLSCAILCVLKSLKLLLMASAYACIVQVLHDMKKDVATVTEERHRAATQLKATLECITPVADQRMSTKATMLARQFYMKVSMLVCTRAMFGPDNIVSVAFQACM